MPPNFSGFSGVLGQKIKALSERDKQKVALGRAICLPAESPPRRRRFLRVKILNEEKRCFCDILEINEELKITVLYVTNDPLEARTLGKKIVFMKDGKITDIG